jgi:hypothetical protein
MQSKKDTLMALWTFPIASTKHKNEGKYKKVFHFIQFEICINFLFLFNVIEVKRKKCEVEGIEGRNDTEEIKFLLLSQYKKVFTS